MTSKNAGHPRTLSIDIGGTSLKVAVLDASGRMSMELMRVETPRPATPVRILEAIVHVAKALGHFDRVSIGFPGVVIGGETRSAPNLHPTWSKFQFGPKLAKKLGRPVRVLNDAGMHGYGVIKFRGVELVLTLGTGMGFALYTNGVYLPNVELAHHPFDRRRTYEQYIGLRAFQRVGKPRWNRRMVKVVKRMESIFYPDHLYLGGGNATQLSIDLPKNAKVVDNAAGVLGGAALWRD